MSKKISFDELLDRRVQRDAEKMKVGSIQIPGTDSFLEAVMPSAKSLMQRYGELAAATDAQSALLCGKHALYDCCPQLRATKLHESLGTTADPMSTLDELFSITDLDNMGGQALKFMGLLPSDGEEAEPPALETVKN